MQQCLQRGILNTQQPIQKIIITHCYRATDTLVKWVDNTIRDIEMQSEEKVVKFYIGKMYVRKNKKSKVFDTMNPNTWRKEGIRSRWCHHKHQDCGRNGMVVLTVVIPRSVIFTSQKKTLYVALTLIPGFHQNYQCQTVMTKQTHSPSHKMKIYWLKMRGIQLKPTLFITCRQRGKDHSLKRLKTFHVKKNNGWQTAVVASGSKVDISWKHLLHYM